jgi:meso-butanediol dehydrogenase/(S,S)-butanediol dehydrogenase/diacetyl reductase
VEDLRRFDGQVVLVTGASRGIGRAIAIRFAEEGARLALAANEERVHDVAGEIEERGGKAISFVTDVTVRSQVQDLFEASAERLGGLDVSVHSAGIITVARLEDLTEEEWDRVMAVNTKGVFLCCQAAARHMTRQRGGRIINIASGQAREGSMFTPHYAASKFGVLGITQSLAKELAPSGITVNALCPGLIETDMWTYNDREWGKLLGYRPGEMMRERIKCIPLGRPGQPEDVAAVAAFLASEDAAYVTGQAMNVDGGLRMC